MTLCRYHYQKTIVKCNWCGRDLCDLCFGRVEGKKHYCQHCTKDLNFVMQRVDRERQKIEKEEQRVVLKQGTQKPDEKKIVRNVVSDSESDAKTKNDESLFNSKTGFFDFSQLKSKRKNEFDKK